MKPNKFSLDFGNDFNENKNLETIDKDKLDAFVKGAVTHSTNLVVEEKKWSDEDPYAEPIFTTTLRLNAYEVGLVKAAAKQQARSKNSLIRTVLVQGLKDIVSQ